MLILILLLVVLQELQRAVAEGMYEEPFSLLLSLGEEKGVQCGQPDFDIFASCAAIHFLLY